MVLQALDGDVPERSTFSKNRHGRFREGDLFRRLFEEVVRRCVAAGLVGGTGAAVDGSVVEADASRGRRLPRRLPEAWSNRESQAQPVRAYLDALDAASAPARDEPNQAAPKHLSETDPQAAWSTKSGAAPKGGVEMNDADMDKVVAGAVLVIGNQDHNPDRSYHSADATLNNPNAQRFFVITHNYGGLPNGPDGPLP